MAEEFAVLGDLGQHPNVVRAHTVLTSSLGRPPPGAPVGNRELAAAGSPPQARPTGEHNGISHPELG